MVWPETSLRAEMFNQALTSPVPVNSVKFELPLSRVLLDRSAVPVLPTTLAVFFTAVTEAWNSDFESLPRFRPAGPVSDIVDDRLKVAVLSFFRLSLVTTT